MPRTPIASHRGGAILWPENSLLAFRHSLALAVEQLELDVHAAADGEPVVMHDATLDRTTDGRGPVTAQSVAALRRLRVKGTGGEPVPLLAEVVALLAGNDRVLRLELKCDIAGRPYPGLLARCLALLDGHGLRARTILMSFEAATVAEAAWAGDGLAGLVWLVDGRPWQGLGEAAAMAVARSCGATEIGLPLSEIGEGLTGRLGEGGLRLGGWGANEEASIRRGLGLGLAALTTDDPVLALRVRG